MLSLLSKSNKPADVSTSDLLPKLFEGFDDVEAGISVLDVGAGSRTTLDFFTRYRCRVFFLDLYELDFGQEVFASAPEALARDTFSRVLGEYRETLFDVCLFWDLLNRLEAPALHGFGDALRPYLYSQTKGYGVCDLFGGKANKSATYSIREINELEVAPSKNPPPDGWSQSALARHFDCFRIVEDTISADGRLEFLMEAD